MIIRKCIFVLVCSMFFGLELSAQNIHLGQDSAVWVTDFEHERDCLNCSPWELPFINEAYLDYGRYISLNQILIEKTNCMKDSIVIIIGTIDSLGLPQDLAILKSVCKEFDQEALRLISQSPPWIPAKYNGINAAIRVIFPVSFNR